MKLFVVLSMVLFFSMAAFAKTYYVSTAGNDSNTGSGSSPWLTIQHAVDQVVAGDTILVKSGVYNELVTFNKSGSEADGYIVLQNAPGESPIIDGSGLAGSGGWIPALIKIISKNYIKVVGFELRNLITSDSGVFPAGIWIRGTSHHIELLNNIVHHIEMNKSNAGAHGIAVYGTSAPDSIHEILLDGNEIYACKLGWSESLVLNGNVSNFIIRNNKVHDNDNIGYDFIGFEGECPDPTYDQARYGQVYDNVVYNIDSRTNPAYGGEASADGFYVDGGRDIVFEHNTAYQCNIGFELASEHKGKSTSGITMRNNFIYDNHVIGIAIGGYDSNRGTTDDCYIVNNSLYNNNTDNLGWGAEILMQYYCQNNTFKNNIIYAAAGKPVVLNETQSGTNNIFDNNLYYGTSGIYWNWRGTEYSSFSAYQSGSGQDAHGLFADPLYISPEDGNLRIGDGSPAIDRGDNLSPDIIGTQDIDKKDRIINSIVDIGAFEYDSVSTGFEQSRDVHHPKAFILYQNFPNPFNPATVIRYKLSETARVEISVYNILGQKLITLINEKKAPGKYEVIFDAAMLPSGVYTYTLQTGDGTRLARKMLYLK